MVPPVLPVAVAVGRLTANNVTTKTPAVTNLGQVVLLAIGPAQAVFCSLRPSLPTVCSRITNFWILPVMVIGKASTNSM